MLVFLRALSGWERRGMGLAENIQRVQERISTACAQVGRDPSGVTLVAVSKTFPPEIILEAFRLGLCDFGENRVEEAGEKISNIKSQISNPTSDLQPPMAFGRSLAEPQGA